MKNLTLKDLEELAEKRLMDAKTLFEAKRYDGAFYICGYAIEMALKRRICVTLDWGKQLSPKGESFLRNNLCN